ncbi:MAG: hypothetical protein Kow00121_59060 [Elainellaceae cyanobacterium]
MQLTYQEDKAMQLTYRSASYQVNCEGTNTLAAELKQGQAIGTYRGVPVLIQFPKTKQQPQFTLPLKYRGVFY